LALSTEQSLLAALARPLEADAGDAHDLGRGVDHVVVGGLVAGFAGAAAGLAEVHAAGEFAHDEHVGAADGLGAEGRRAGEGLGHGHGAEVGEDAEFLADLEQAAFRAHFAGVVVPLGSADGAEEHGMGGLALGDHGVGHGVVVLVDRRAPGHVLDVANGESVLLRATVQHAPAFADHVGSDSVTGQNNNIIGLGGHGVLLRKGRRLYPAGADCKRNRRGAGEGRHSCRPCLLPWAQAGSKERGARMWLPKTGPTSRS
jgi:hypothetical protein